MRAPTIAAALLFLALMTPASGRNLSAWIRAITVVTASAEATMRRRYSSVVSDHILRSLDLLGGENSNFQEQTGKFSRPSFI